MSKELKEHGYYKEKGVVEKLASKFVGQIRMLQSGDILQVRTSQPLHEQTLPAVSRAVLVVFKMLIKII